MNQPEELSKPIIVNTPEGLANAILRLHSQVKEFGSVLHQLLEEWREEKKQRQTYVTHRDCLEAREACTAKQPAKRIKTTDEVKRQKAMETGAQREAFWSGLKTRLAVAVSILVILAAFLGFWRWTAQVYSISQQQIAQAKKRAQSQNDIQKQILKLLQEGKNGRPVDPNH